MVNKSIVMSVAKRFSRLAMDVGMVDVELRLMDVIPVSRENRSQLEEPLSRTDVAALALPPPNRPESSW
jgi:hypothetical protein